MILWNLDCLIFDVTTAFLNGDLAEIIFMDCPEGMEHEKDECLALDKAIYGLVQAARQYFKKFEEILVKRMGFQQCKSDPCLYMRKSKKGIVIILSYIDDNLCVGNKEALSCIVVGNKVQRRTCKSKSYKERIKYYRPCNHYFYFALAITGKHLSPVLCMLQPLVLGFHARFVVLHGIEEGLLVQNRPVRSIRSRLPCNG